MQIARQAFLQLRQQGIDAFNHGQHVGARLALDIEDHRWRAVGPGGQAHVLGIVVDAGDILHPYRRAVEVGDDQLAVVFGAFQLVIGIQAGSALGAVETALGAVQVIARHRAAQVFQAQVVGRQGHRIGANTHGRTLATADTDQTDTRDLRDFLCHARVDQILNLRQRQAVGENRQAHDRCIGGVDLAEHRRRRQVVGQQAGGDVDRRLHVLLGHVEVGGQAKAQGQQRGAAGAAGTHFGKAGYLAELAFQRCSHR